LHDPRRGDACLRSIALVLEPAPAHALADDRDLPEGERMPERERGEVAAGLGRVRLGELIA
jgi:hypothetical protein